MNTIDVMPSNIDLLSAGIAAGVSWFQKEKNPGWSGAEQLAAIISGKNLAQWIEATDAIEGDILKEYDAYTAATRAGISYYYKRTNNKIGMDAVKGAVCNISARYLSTYLNLT